MYHQALCAAEDETDVQAAKIVAAEQQAEMAEFDENIPWDEKESEAKKERDEATSRVEQELAMIQKEVILHNFKNLILYEARFILFSFIVLCGMLSVLEHKPFLPDVLVTL